jgi:ribosomal protein S18 acetylase RimI-like enzyme
MNVRRAMSDDAKRMCEISFNVHAKLYNSFIPDENRDKFIATYTPSLMAKKKFIASIQAKQNDASWDVWVAEQDGKVVGYTLGVHESSMLFVKHGLFVDASYQGRGIGGALFRKSLESLTLGCVVRLFVINANTSAQLLYRKQGFEIVGQSDKDFFGAPMSVMEYSIH